MNHLANLPSTSPSLATAAITASTLLLCLLVKWWRSKGDHQHRYKMADPPKDTVVLHQYGQRGWTVPSVSPFVMKLETYLRVAKIPYVNKYDRCPGPKGKLPWIQYNGKIIADSQFCIQFLNAEMNVNLNKNLRPEQISLGHLVRRTAEESLYWVLVMWRLVLEKTGFLYKKLGVPSLFLWVMRRQARSALWNQGLGRHGQEEVLSLMEEDLNAISQILGEKNFLFGNEGSEVTEFDCALFGQLCQLAWQTPGTPVEQTLADKYPNLVSFCHQIKSNFWSDWDERVQQTLPASSATSQTKTCQTSDSKPAVPRSSDLHIKRSKLVNKVTAPKLEKEIIPNTFKERLRKSVSMTSNFQAFHVQSQLMSPSRKVSASSILADKATLISA